MKTTYDLNMRLRMFRVHYIGPGNVLGSRIQIKDLRNNKIKYLSYDNEFRDIQDQALNYLEKIGIPVDGIGLADKDSDCVLLSNDIATPLT